MMRVIVAWIVGLGLAANGLTMLAFPDAWYDLVPGVLQLLVDLPTVFLPPALAIRIAWSPRSLTHMKSLAHMKET